MVTHYLFAQVFNLLKMAALQVPVEQNGTDEVLQLIQWKMDTFGEADILPLLTFHSQVEDTAPQVIIQPESVKSLVGVCDSGFSPITGCYQVFSEQVGITQLSSLLSQMVIPSLTNIGSLEDDAMEVDSMDIEEEMEYEDMDMD